MASQRKTKESRLSRIFNRNFYNSLISGTPVLQASTARSGHHSDENVRSTSWEVHDYSEG